MNCWRIVGQSLLRRSLQFRLKGLISQSFGRIILKKQQKQLQLNRNYNKMKVATQEQILEFFRQKYGAKQRKIYAYYSSDFGQVITQQHLMMIPVDDRIAVRAHGVFDVVYIKKCRLINLFPHIDRLINSASTVGIDVKLTRDQIADIVTNVSRIVLSSFKEAKIANQQIEKLELGVRITISSGHGDFGISSLGKKPVLYVCIFEPYINYKVEREGVNQFVVKTVSSINKELAHTKTINYIDNALMANASKEKGGYMGIKSLQNGVLLEAAVANIGFVFGKQFATPKFQNVIEGTTIKKTLEYLKELQKKGEIDKISFRDITVEEVLTSANEMMVIGGDKIVPVLNFNGKSISKTKGPITQQCQLWYEAQIQQGDNVQINY